MAKITLPTIKTGYNLNQINSNFQNIATVLNNYVLFRNNTTGQANSLETNLDANGKRIINLPAPSSANEPVRLVDIQALTGQTPVVDWYNITNKPATFPPATHTHVISDITGLASSLSAKQDALASGSNIKTVNGQSLLGSGDLTVTSSGAAWGSITGTLSSQSDLSSALAAKQATLVSGTNIKTVGGTSLLGSGDIAVGGTGTVTTVSVVTANGFAGTVANASTTPSITLTTSLTGLLKGNGTAMSAATAETDYVTPSGTGTLSNKTLTTPTVNGYTEGITSASSGTAYTLTLTNAISLITLTANTTLTLPTAVAGKSFVVKTVQDATGGRTITWSGNLKWPAATAPTVTTTASKGDRYIFTCYDGTYWEGIDAGRNF